MKDKTELIKFQVFISNDRILTFFGDKAEVDKDGSLSILNDNARTFYAPMHQWQCYLVGDLVFTGK